MRSHARKREPRRGRESNPRIEVLQTPTLPLGCPAILANVRLGACNHCANVATVSSWRHRSLMSSFVRPNFLHRSELSHPNPRGPAKHLQRELNNAGAQSVTLNSQLMKTNTLLGATLALMVFAAAPLFGQTSTTSTTSTSYVQSSSIIGSKIKDSRGQDVGEIKDVVLDRSSGCLAYVVLSTHGGGTTTTTTKTVAAPWTVFSASSEPRVYMTRVEREKIYSAPVWESTRIEEYSRPEYINQVYGYYGVTTSFSLGVTSTTGTTGTTTTGANPTTNSAASTNASATPAASAGATMTPAATASVEIGRAHV